MTEVNSIEELITHAEQELATHASQGNPVAQEWHTILQAAPADATRRLFLFSEMKIALMGDRRSEAQAVYIALFAGEGA